MMHFSAYIPLSGVPYYHSPESFLRLEKYQQAAALEVIYKFVLEGKVLGPLPGSTRVCRYPESR